MNAIAVPYEEGFIEVFSYGQHKYQDVLRRINLNEIFKRLTPLLCGILVSMFSVMMVYFDSNVPGVDPPIPFSSQSRQRYRQQQRASLHLNYMTAIASGVVVCGLMLYSS